MTSPRGSVDVSLEGGPFADVPARTVRARAQKMLAHLGLEQAEVSVALVDDKAMRRLHERWMGDPSTTDVLSFPLHQEPRAALRASRATQLGDIAICVPQARRQARARKAAAIDEATALLAHGVLHLLGFDHVGADEEREMFALAGVLEAAARNRRPLKARIEVRP